MKMLKRTTFFAICLIFVQAHAELSVSYEPYTADDIAITVGTNKITAAQLAKHGIESVRMTIKNDGPQDETFTCNKPCISIDEVYKKLKCSQLKAGGMGLLVAVGGCLVISAIVLTRITRRSPGLLDKVVGLKFECDEMISKEEFGTKLYDFVWDKIAPEIQPGHDKDVLERGFCLDCCLLKSCTVLSPILFIYPIYSAYKFNAELHTLLQNELLVSAVMVPSGQAITKIMLVKKMEEKHDTREELAML